MTIQRNSVRILAALAGALAMQAADNPGRPIQLPVEGGLASFDVGTNISAVSVHGKTSSVRATVKARRDGGQVFMDEIQAVLPVNQLSTGLGLRDDHMKKYIFTTSENTTPDLKFSAVNAACPLDGASAPCAIQGKLSIRGVEKPFTFFAKVRSADTAYKAIGDGVVKLSDYGIERPSQFGVKCADEVKIHLELQGRETSAEASARLGLGK